MNAFWTGAAAAPGLLPDARHRLSAIAGDLGALQAETAWECRAADEYRASLDGLVAELRDLRESALDLEADLKAAWAQAAAAGAW
jgi:hypothetical protein